MPQIPDHLYRILIVPGSGSTKTIVLLNLINNEPDINKIYLCPKDPYEAKFQLLISKRKSAGINILMILKPLLNTQTVWIIFTKTLKNTT